MVLIRNIYRPIYFCNDSRNRQKLRFMSKNRVTKTDNNGFHALRFTFYLLVQ